MFNKTIITAGTLILSMMVLIAATQIDTDKVKDQDRNQHTLSGVVVDADTEEGVANATVYLKKSNGEDGMQADRTQQDQQQHQEGVTRTQDGTELESTTTDQNGEFTFENIDVQATQGAQSASAQTQAQTQQAQTQGQNDVQLVLVVEAEGYETEEKEINLSDYTERDEERDVMDRDQDRDHAQDMDRDKEDKNKVKIELTRINQY